MSAKVLRFIPKVSSEAEKLADLAYEMWLSRCFRAHGSPEKDFLEAQKALLMTRREREGKVIVLRKHA